MSTQLFHGDCLEIMPTLPDKSVDAIVADWPYGTTACKWDSVIPLDKLWPECKRVIKDRGAIVLFGSQPFTSALIMSNPKWFKYEWIWNKVQPTGALTVKYQPMKLHENILVFCSGSTKTYNRQMTDANPESYRPNRIRNKLNQKRHDGYDHVGTLRMVHADDYDPSKTNPQSILRYTKLPKIQKALHPTQKPLALLKYLVKTYTNPGDTVLDNTMGSGTCGEACVNTGRNFIGIEKDEHYFNVAKARIEKAQPALLEVA